jgi:hypothetical protein
MEGEIQQMIIGCSGKAGSGKGELAKIAKEEFGATIVSFASGVKEEVGEFLDKYEVCWEHRHLYGSQADKEATLCCRLDGIELFDQWFLEFADRHARITSGESQRIFAYFTPRVLLQYYGTEYRRAQDSNYWADKGLRKCRGDGLFVIDDVRFQNEAAAVIAAGGILIRVERPGVYCSTPNHPSETDLDQWTDWHAIINNDLDLAVYRGDVRRVLSKVLV